MEFFQLDVLERFIHRTIEFLDANSSILFQVLSDDQSFTKIILNTYLSRKVFNTCISESPKGTILDSSL